MTVVGEFLRFGAAQGWVAVTTTALLSEPKQLCFIPPGYDTGEWGKSRQVQRAAFRFKITEPGYEDLSDEQIRQMIALAPRARDRFLIALLACTGLRIGEALGLRRGDMHLLASSRTVGCGIEGPHVHVRRRTDKPNRALAKSCHHRFVPVTADLVALYTDYQYERDQVSQAAESQMVFVNLFRPPLGGAMSYPNTKEMFDRLARTAGHACRPHMLHHSAATRWLRDGVDRDVVQRLLGHASPLSMEHYRHVDDAEARAATRRSFVGSGAQST
ncbi:tyrosine-type recombinase/integrase [Streptomyces sp. NPDC056910]|uniref:tyrosine-type recombinase/integrase n=1 Tax=Streptomyces sp. NPDC056910 TaxID=3345964 RepID=UPI0036BFD516